MKGIRLLLFLLVSPLFAAGCARGVPDAPAPLAASTDAALVARGRYLAYGPAHCVACHTPEGPATPVVPGDEPLLTGGFPFRFPGGTVPAPNLTPDPETGIGRYTDAQLVRMLRHGLRADGRKAVPVMTYQNLADDDVQALLSFLRAQPAVRHEVPARRLNLPGRMAMALLVGTLKPERVTPMAPPREATVARGRYLVEDVAQCAGCHTKRGATGGLKGPLLAGGLRMPADDDPDLVFVTPNLTPDPETGLLARWTEEQFVARFKAGRRLAASHMPWDAYATMDEADLRAMYRYLRTVTPVRRETGPPVQRRR